MGFKNYMNEIDNVEELDCNCDSVDLHDLVEMLIEDGNVDAISHISEEIMDILDGNYDTEEEEEEYYAEDEDESDEDEDESDEDIDEMLKLGELTEAGARRLKKLKKGKSFFKGSKTSAKRKRKQNKFKDKGKKRIQNMKNKRKYKTDPSKRKYKKFYNKAVKSGKHVKTTRRG